MKQAFGLPPSGRTTAHAFMPTQRVNRTFGRQINDSLATTLVRIREEKETIAEIPEPKKHKSSELSDAVDLSDNDDDNISKEAARIPMFMDEDDDISDNNFSDHEKTPGAITCNIIPNLGEPFQEYMRNSIEAYSPFTKQQAAAIQLLIRLRKRKASLDTYEDVMEWHFLENGKITERQTIAQCADYISKKRIFQFLRIRYNVCPKSYGNIATISLPHSRAKVNIVRNDAKTAIVSLLTDPRIVDEDYMFWDNNPLAPPPRSPAIIKDLNTGSSYTKTYADLVTKPGKQVLLPVIFYIDGANTGQFADLPITAVKISLGIFTRKARDKEHLWRTIGYIPAYSAQQSRGIRQMLDANHVDGVMAHPDAQETEGLEPNKAVAKAQDLHTMLANILTNYI